MSGPRFVELVRVSTSIQADRDTPELQRLALEKLRAQRPGVLVSRIETEGGVSGARGMAQRPDLLQLRELTGTYDELRVYAIDRLTRAEDPRERFAVFGLVADAKAKIVDCSSRVIDPTDEMGEIDFYLQTLFAARERKKIAARSRAGCARKAAEGKLPRGRPPYGRTFDRATGAWGIDPGASKIYRRIFQLYLSGLSVLRVCERLDQDGVAPPRGSRWRWSVVRGYLRDRAAVGEWNAHGVTMRVPPVIDVATFEATQKRLTENRRRCGRLVEINDALLRKILACGICGRTMYIRRCRGRKGQVYRYYQCGSAVELRQDPACRRTYDVTRYDAAVKAEVEAFLGGPGLLSLAAQLQGGPDLGDELAEAEAAVKRVDREEANLARLGRRGMFSARVLEGQAKEVAELRASAEGRLSAMRAAVAAREQAAEVQGHAEARVAFLRRRIARATPAEWCEVLALLFPRGPGLGLVMMPDGRIEGRGGIPLGIDGVAQVRAVAERTAALLKTGRIEIPISLGQAAPPRKARAIGWKG